MVLTETRTVGEYDYQAVVSTVLALAALALPVRPEAQGLVSAHAVSPALPLQAQLGMPYGDALLIPGPRRGPSTS
jgi:hypothetical protein